jgi:hypothetical protein
MTYSALISTTTGIFEGTSEELDGLDVMFISLPNTPTNRTLVATDQNATLTWGANTLFAGRCTGAEYTRGMLKCICYNQVYEALARAQPLDIIYDPAVDTASDVLTAIAATIGIASSWHGADPAIGARLSFANPMDALEWLAKATNNDFWTTTGPLTIHVGTRGTNRGAVAILEDSKRVIDRAKQRNNIRVRGVNASGNVIYGTASAGGSDRYATFTEKKASAVANLNDLAAKLLAETNKADGPSPLAVSLIAGNGTPLFPGDTVTITQDDLGLPAGSYRIYKVERSIDKVVISVAYPSDTTDKKLWDTRKYEELGIYTVAASQIPKGIQSWNSDIVFTAADWDTATWGAGTITFADGTTQAIDAGSTGNLGAAGTYYVYFTYGSATLTVTGTYSAAVGPSKGILAKLIVSVDTTQKIGIETMGAKGTTIIKDHIAEDAVYAAAMKPGIQPYESTIEFYKNRTDHAGSNHADIHWHAGTIIFADGSSQAINAGQKTGMVDLDTWYLYFSLGNTTLQATSDYANVTGNTVGLLCKAYISVDPDQDVSFHAIAGKRSNWISDFVGAKAINTIHIDTDSIYGKDIATQALVGTAGGNAGIRIIGDAADIVGAAIGDAIGGNFTAGIWGFKSGPLARTFFINPANGEIAVYGTVDGYTGYFTIYTGLGVRVGDIYAIDASPDRLEVASQPGKLLRLICWTSDGFNAYHLELDPAVKTVWSDLHIIPFSSGTLDLGGSSNVWRDVFCNHVRLSTFTLGTMPAANSTNVGKFCYTHSAGGKGKLWICMQNDADGYEWVQVAITT